ncbi:armadillo-type protein [Bombardia bombarda]|uniref:Armadillo-type protein n=1 Tax=Bombardia bombarda TaxID=252184 RepID=A0AA39XIB9_9PEZI|nr:armadillo-type protein [Bombardia bombarda]
MSTTASTGSPSERRTVASKSFSQDENARHPDEFTLSHTSQESVAAVTLKKSVTALATSKLANQNCPKKLKTSHDSPSSMDSYPMDKLFAKLSEHQVILPQHEAMKYCDDEGLYNRVLDHQSSCSSLPITPATENFDQTAPTTRSASATPNEGGLENEELLRLKLELAQCQNKITRLEAEKQPPRVDQDLTQPRLITQTSSGRATPGLGSEPDFSTTIAGSDFQSAIGGGVSPIASRFPVGPAFNASGKLPFSRDNNWTVQDDARSDISDPLSAGGMGCVRGIWNNSNNKPNFANAFPQVPMPVNDAPQPIPWTNNRTIPQTYEPSFTNSNVEAYRPDRMASDHEIVRPVGRRSNRFDNRFGGAPNNFAGGYGGYNVGPGQFEAASAYPSPLPGAMPGAMSNGMGIGLYSPFQQQPVGTPLSPHATEFTSAGAPWKTESLASEGQTYLPATEPLNYRRLLDRNVTCDWKYIVDKIVCNNDQQASIFLQQKLKVGTPEQKYDIVEAIVAQAYPLMVNRFGNFLVQRCFEHGTPEQVIKIASAIRGNTLNLSMDPFGCHVVQKAFDSVPEEFKAVMVHELLRRIPETVIHRYACHVWQKLFELRWTESPPQIMKYVNEALRGMWHEVALGETGSLVVQNIFENCLEEDKRPCIEEVLANIDIVAHGQFGNWCIQHICEHGAPADRSRAIDHVIRYAAEYSMDQFASKVVEKCLKIGGPDFLGRYLDRVCEGRVDRPRIPLIDIASDQYGNYLIQYILTHANPQHREIVAAHIRKHMVSLRGSKFGSRVGMLCTNHAVATRPGPGIGPAMGSRMVPGPRFGGAYR